MSTLFRFDPYHVVFDKCKMSGENYLKWTDKVKQFLKLHMLDAAVPDAYGKECKDVGNVTEQTMTAALVALRTHLDDGLCDLYTEETDPNAIWQKLKTKYSGVVASRKALIEQLWHNLAVDSHPTLDSYEAKMHEIIREMKQCDPKRTISEADKVHKTIETLGTAQHSLQTTLRAAKYQTFDELMHDLREHDSKARLAQEREAFKTRRDVTAKIDTAETHLTRAKPYDKERRPKKRHDDQQLQEKRNNGPNKGEHFRCYACGSRSHIIAKCDASDAEITRYARERIDIARTRKRINAARTQAESNFTLANRERESDIWLTDFVAKDAYDIDEAEVSAIEVIDN